MSNFTWEYDLPIDDFAVGHRFGGRKIWRDKNGKIERTEEYIFAAELNDRGKLVGKNLATGEIIYPFNT